MGKSVLLQKFSWGKMYFYQNFNGKKCIEVRLNN